MEGLIEPRDLHEHEGGWYSEAVMATSLRVLQNIYMLDLNRPITAQDDSAQRIYANDVHGVVVNVQQIHWVTFKYHDGEIWFLDSLQTPTRKTFEQFRNYIAQNPNAFVVRHIV